MQASPCLGRALPTAPPRMMANPAAWAAVLLDVDSPWLGDGPLGRIGVRIKQNGLFEGGYQCWLAFRSSHGDLAARIGQQEATPHPIRSGPLPGVSAFGQFLTAYPEAHRFVSSHTATLSVSGFKVSKLGICGTSHRQTAPIHHPPASHITQLMWYSTGTNRYILPSGKWFLQHP